MYFVFCYFFISSTLNDKSRTRWMQNGCVCININRFTVFSINNKVLKQIDVERHKGGR